MKCVYGRHCYVNMGSIGIKMNFVRVPIPKESSLLESGSRASEIWVKRKVEDLSGDGKMMANFFPP